LVAISIAADRNKADKRKTLCRSSNPPRGLLGLRSCRSIAMSRWPDPASEVYASIADHVPFLHRYARALLRSRDGVEDLVQDTVARALARAHQWQPGTNMRRWLGAILHSQYVNAIRHSARRQGLRPGPLTDALQLSRPPDQVDALIVRDVNRALRRLPPEHREILLLVGLGGLAYDEAAAVMGVAVGTVRSRLSRARDILYLLTDGAGRCPAGIGDDGARRVRPRCVAPPKGTAMPRRHAARSKSRATGGD
jgi:RNA polymerase sigma-70 factor, ECF subfamily